MWAGVQWCVILIFKRAHSQPRPRFICGSDSFLMQHFRSFDYFLFLAPLAMVTRAPSVSVPFMPFPRKFISFVNAEKRLQKSWSLCFCLWAVVACTEIRRKIKKNYTLVHTLFIPGKTHTLSSYYFRVHHYVLFDFSTRIFVLCIACAISFHRINSNAHTHTHARASRVEQLIRIYASIRCACVCVCM